MSTSRMLGNLLLLIIGIVVVLFATNRDADPNYEVITILGYGKDSFPGQPFGTVKHEVFLV
jgi:hypothetical protein